MPTFNYRVRTQDGRLQAGVVDATDAEEASSALAERGFEVLLLEPVGKFQTKGGGALPFLNRVKTRDIVVASRMLSVMVSASVPLVDALKNVASQATNPYFRSVLADVAAEVESGARFSDALGRYPKVFSSFFVNMIRSSETSGQMEKVLEYLADQQEKDYDLTSKLRGAMTYPVFILFALFVVGFIMIAFVVPKLTQILVEANVPLPITTRVLIVVSGFFASYWWLILLFVAVLGVAFRFSLQTPGGRLVFDRILLNIPLVKLLFSRIYSVRFCRSLSTLLRGGIDQISALEVVAGVVGNSVWRQMVYETIREVNEGNSITTVFVNNPYAPTMMTQMLAVGEETGSLQMVLERVAAFFSREVDNITSSLVTLIEPLVIILLGIGVGVMVSAILLPLYQLSSAI